MKIPSKIDQKQIQKDIAKYVGIQLTNLGYRNDTQMGAPGGGPSANGVSDNIPVVEVLFLFFGNLNSNNGIYVSLKYNLTEG